MKNTRQSKLSLGAHLYYSYKLVTQITRFISALKSNRTIKTNELSRELYQQYDNREQLAHSNNSLRCIHDGKLKWLAEKQIRQLYLDYVIQSLPADTQTILEVGCGNCLNLAALKQQTNAKLTGIDISERRIEVARKYLGQNLDGIELDAPVSITERTPFPENHFDVVFSMHCLEQISYDSMRAVQEMYRIARYRVIFVEPVFENGNLAQKLYLTTQDHNRILLSSIRESGLKPICLKPLSIQSNPLNQSSLVILEKCPN